MSATSFRPGDVAAPPAAPTTSSHRATLAVAPLLDVALAVFGVASVVTMWRFPEWATIPYHLLFLMTMLVYGYRVWSVPVTAVVLALIVVLTGALMIGDYREGAIAGEELAEIALMPALLVAMVWHARRRVAAMQRLKDMASLQRAMREREHNFFRDASHAIRTPVTIAQGHLELAVQVSPSGAVAEDIGVALRQLGRMNSLSSRLLALAQLESGELLPVASVDLTAFVEEVGGGWAANQNRIWVVDSQPGGAVAADPVWLALAVDALIENAVHFTLDGGHIAIHGRVGPDTCSIVVSDDGVGILADELERVFERFWHKLPPSGQMGSGLGLAMTRAAARSWGGHVHATNNADGGATFALVLPRAEDPTSD